MLRIGIDLGGTKIEGVVIDGESQVLARIRAPTPRDDYPATLSAIAELVASLEKKAADGFIGSLDKKVADGFKKPEAAGQITRPSTTVTPEPCAVGIGAPGAISPATGLVKNSNSVWLNGRPFKEDLEKQLGRKIRMANDADCFTLSEAVDGAAAGASPVFGVILGTGVGGGVVFDGRIVTGPNAIGGEWGHNPLPWPTDDERPGPPCYCGRKGCIETFLSGPGMAGDHARVTGRELSSQEIVREAAEVPEAGENAEVPEAGEAAEVGVGAGDGAAAECRATLDRYEERLARALAMVINLLDPEVIVLGGGLSAIDRLYDSVPRRWGKWVFSDRVDTRLVPPRHGDAGGVRGAAWLWTPAE